MKSKPSSDRAGIKSPADSQNDQTRTRLRTGRRFNIYILAAAIVAALLLAGPLAYAIFARHSANEKQDEASRQAGQTGLDTTNSGQQTWWQPEAGLALSWQLSGKVDTSIDAAVYDIDLFDSSKALVQSLQSQGRRTVCYTSLGAHENWRPDAGDFAPAILGKNNGWEGERWIDIRQLDTPYTGRQTLRQIIEARLDMCADKGFDAVEPDNIDGYVNDTGFPIKAKDQLIFNKFLAAAAHERGLAIALKNDLDQIPQLVDVFDFAINEQCAQYGECGALKAFIAKNKPVFQIEYELPLSQFCPQAKQNGFFAMRKNYELDAYRQACT